MATSVNQNIEKYNAACAAMNAAKAAGKLWRVKHPQYGHSLIEAADADKALAGFLRKKLGIESADKATLDQYKPQTRIAKVK